MKSKYDWIRKAQRCLRMLSELHRLGFQHLRGMPYFNAQGFRFAIAPRYFFFDNGIAIPAAKLSDELVAITGAGHFFSWTDTEGNDARALAEKFIIRFPDIAHAGKGRDWEYAGWLSELIGFLEQGDMIPTVWWEEMNGRPEDLLALPVWVEGKDNIDWVGEKSIISQTNPHFPLPGKSEPSGSEWWGRQPYWTDALHEMSQAMQDGGRLVNIDVKKIEDQLFMENGPAYKLLKAMNSVSEHEGYDGFKGAPRLVLALLWKLQEMSEQRNRKMRK
ncbi:hypothetical protein [Leclercia adecarboxylata]|uniref:hypothetical protein n=1 Tax=Leclercia adecarboxylata TaxID=83655 RepID=UPI00057B54BE|nr:hypothetical protein [Leclercia adecarboxylata]